MSVADEWGPRAHQRRAVRLLQGGLVGAHALGALGVLAWVFIGDGSHAVWAVFGMVAVLLFFTLGQWIQIAFSAMDPMRLMMVTLVGYAIRVAGLAAFFFALDSIRAPGDQLARLAAATVLIVAVIGWVAGEIVTFRRLRIPIYDQEYEPPSHGSEPM